MALGNLPADLVVLNGNVVDVYTGETRPANVAVAGGQIAYAGPASPATGPDSVVLDAKNLLIVPGYIEPHAHPDFIYNPLSVGQFYLSRGTTTVVGDTYKLHAYLGPEGFIEFNRLFQKIWPGHFYWTARLFPESPSAVETDLYCPEQMAKVLDIDEVLGLGELSRWPDILTGDERILTVMALARSKNKLLDGHTAGARDNKLAGIAAAGIAGCHESINPGQALERLQNGMYVPLRHSSHRPDLPLLLPLLTKPYLDTGRVMFTGDGAVAPFLAREAHPGALARLAVQRGVPPVLALRAVTANCAAYFNLGNYLGGIAPGRAADFNLVADWRSMDVPEIVVAKGQVVATRGQLVEKIPALPWFDLGFPTWSFNNLDVRPGIFALPVNVDGPDQTTAWPVVHLDDGVITRRRDEYLPVTDGQLDLPAGQGFTFMFLLDPSGNTISKGVLKGMVDQVDGFASSFNCTLGALLVLGHDPAAMTMAAQRVIDLGGGMVLCEEGRVLWELPLQVAGIMSLLPFESLVGELTHLEELMRQRGYRFTDFLHSLFFLAIDFLPFIRLTARGLYDVKHDRILYPAEKL